VACSPCAERVALLQATRQSLKRTTTRRCSDALRARISATVVAERQRQSEERAPEGSLGPKLVRLRYAVGLAAAAGVVFAMGMARHAHPHAQPDAKPRTDVASSMTGFDILDDLIALHANPLPPETT